MAALSSFSDLGVSGSQGAGPGGQVDTVPGPFLEGPGETEMPHLRSELGTLGLTKIVGEDLPTALYHSLPAGG